MELVNPDEIPILCFRSVLSYVACSFSTDKSKINDLKYFYNEFDKDHKLFFKKAVLQYIEFLSSKEAYVPDWLIEFEKYVLEN